MKKVSDYQGEEALELWADLIEPMSEILVDPEMKKVFESKKSNFAKISAVIRAHKKEVIAILSRIDDTPVNGINIVARALSLLKELGDNKEFASFFE